ncbi:MAG: PD40 domain-containing protein [Anaerolineae bacterium]|nr:PD40 domain-containing protein [Anaerolineae bacterium]
MRTRKYIYFIVFISSIFGAACTQQPSILSETKQVPSPSENLATEPSVSLATNTVPPVEVTSTLVPEVTETTLPITSTMETVGITSTISAHPLTPIPVDNLDLADSLILYMTAIQLADKDFWALQALPNILTFDQSVFETFYGEVIDGVDSEDQSRYFFNFRPQSSPNGRYLLLPGIGGYTNPNGDLGTGLWLADLQEETSRQLLPQAKIATWSPQNDEMTYVEGDILYILSIDEESTPIPLFSHPNLNWLYARWSPDGKWIATMTSQLREPEEAGDPEITNTYWIVPTNGDPAWKLATRDSFAIEYIAEEMTWSPDSLFLLVRNEVFDLAGRQIAPQLPGKVHWLHNQLLVNSDDGLHIVTVEGQELASMGHSFASAWAFSHDGQHLAYVQSSDNGQVDIYTFNLETMENFLVGSIPTSFLSIIRWGSDDQYLFLDDGQDTSPIWIIDTQLNGSTKQILDKGILIEVISISDN